MLLDEIIPKFLSNDEMRPAMQKPCLIDGFVYATDAHVLLKVNVSLLENTYEYVERYPNVVGVINDVVPNANIKIEFSWLNSILDKIPLVDDFDYEDCKKCEGQGEIECFSCGYSHDCKECKGEGEFKKKNGKKTFDHEHAVKIGIAVFDPKFLKLVIELGEILNVEHCLINANYEKKANLFYFSDDVQVLVMPKMESQFGQNNTVIKY